MKKLLFLLAISLFYACTKDSGNEPPTIAKSEFKFDFNGRTYSGSNTIITVDEYKILRELFLYGPDIFGGEIHYFPEIKCGFMIPGGSWEWTTYMNPNCRIKVNGLLLIDSVAVYFYQSGNFNYTVSSCVNHSGFTLDGIPVQWDECTVTGTFNLTFANKNNDLIEIKNGSFRYEKYWIDK